MKTVIINFIIVLMVINLLGCTSKPPANTYAVVGLKTPKPGVYEFVENEVQAKKLAKKLLKKMNCDWGKPTKVTITRNQYFVVEFGKDSRGVRRVVLVNQKNGHAAFPQLR